MQVDYCRCKLLVDACMMWKYYYVKFSSQLAIATALHIYSFINRQANQIQRYFHGHGLKIKYTLEKWWLYSEKNLFFIALGGPNQKAKQAIIVPFSWFSCLTTKLPSKYCEFPLCEELKLFSERPECQSNSESSGRSTKKVETCFVVCMMVVALYSFIN